MQDEAKTHPANVATNAFCLPLPPMSPPSSAPRELQAPSDPTITTVFLAGVDESVGEPQIKCVSCAPQPMTLDATPPLLTPRFAPASRTR